MIGHNPDATREFMAARDLLLELREDHDAAVARFDWPRPSRFNWALDWFDQVAVGNTRTAVRLVDAFSGHTTGGVPVATGVSYAELAERSNRVANWLRALGTRRGDRILLMLDNQLAVWESVLAAMKLGAVVIPTYTSISGADLADRLTRGQVTHVITEEHLTDRFEPAPPHLVRIATGDRLPGWHCYQDSNAAPAGFVPDGDTLAGDPLFVYFTSGTTSAPKMAAHTHASYPIGHLSGMYWNGLVPGDVHANISAPGWAKHAWSSFFGPFNAEATVLAVNLPPGEPHRLPGILDKERATSLCAPPTAWRTLVQHDLGRRPSALRELSSVGEPLNPEVIERVRAAWGLTVRDGYGQTEVTALVGNTAGLPVRPGAMGKPLPGYPILLIDPKTKRPADEGEICIDLSRAPAGVMTEYLGDPAKTAAVFADGYYHTGDIAHRDSDGYLTYVGRRDDVFKSFDHRISPFELESVLLRHPLVAEAAVIPVSHPVGMFVPKAYVALAADASPDRTTALSLLEFAAEELAPHQRIASVEFADLPKTTSGKIRRAELRAAEEARRAGRATSRADATDATDVETTEWHSDDLLGGVLQSAPGL
ncbi:acetyl-CoA synthetase [Streptacidiphilus sp. BW17]|uniref:AMP-binding protein n=1 Tax=Streptacidiphilus sp. BW17 TaxID=3156274 RepID=UPI0035168240